ncbi:hypothetical protein ACFO4O_00955 [Glaciecola siphonariae]|uniref:Uncharacterized protein n=1 Tax=Glaciecola siphonariae TaxID=521012 RepID=A0ABV9LS19_9ALTE
MNIRTKTNRLCWLSLPVALLGALLCFQAHADLIIRDLGKDYTVEPNKVVSGLYLHVENDDDVIGGNTSVRNETADTLKWKGKQSSNGFGYFQRNRDLGQVFNVPPGKDIVIDAIVLRTSRGNNAIMSGTPGSLMYLQFFEVDEIDGERLTINDAGTRKGDRALHGFDHQFNRADDYIEGAKYTPFKRVTGGTFPDIPHTTQYVYEHRAGEPYGEQEGHLRYIRFDLTGDDEITLKANKRYGFLLGFESPGKHRGLALAIQTDVHTKEDATFSVDANGMIHWGIRREGDGGIFPSIVSLPEPPTDEATLIKLTNESMFPKNHWDSIPPATKGFPDVDTYRTLQYYIEVK